MPALAFACRPPPKIVTADANERREGGVRYFAHRRPVVLFPIQLYQSIDPWQRFLVIDSRLLCSSTFMVTAKFSTVLVVSFLILGLRLYKLIHLSDLSVHKIQPLGLQERKGVVVGFRGRLESSVASWQTIKTSR